MDHVPSQDKKTTTNGWLVGTTIVLASLIVSGCTPDSSDDRLTELKGTSWKIVGIPQRVKASMSFGDDGRVSGSLGCNRFNADYKTSGQSLEIGKIAATRKMCPAVEMSVENELLKSLPTINRWSGDANKIELMAPTNQMRIRLERAEPR